MAGPCSTERLYDLMVTPVLGYWAASCRTAFRGCLPFSPAKIRQARSRILRYNRCSDQFAIRLNYRGKTCDGSRHAHPPTARSAKAQGRLPLGPVALGLKTAAICVLVGRASSELPRINPCPASAGLFFRVFRKESPARAGLSLPMGMGLSRCRHPTDPNLHTRVS